jgi:hypothetical protein
MTRGWAGVNLHGGGDGIYTPIAGAPSRGFTRRPEYFGIRFAQRFAGAAVIETTITNASDRVDVFAFERHGVQELVIVNKTAEDVSCALPAGLTASRRSTLHAAAIDARDGVQITESKSAFASVAAAAPYTANVYALRQSPRTSITGRKR